MSNAATRRRNLRSLKLDPKTFQQRAGRTYSYWRDLLESDTKSFGEKAARSIEEDLGLPRGWLDRETASDEGVNLPVPAPMSDDRLVAELRQRIASIPRPQREALIREMTALILAPDSDEVGAALAQMLHSSSPEESRGANWAPPPPGYRSKPSRRR